MATHVFGIRHHGPGSARSLLNALEELRPDAVLIEGPPDAAEVLAHAAHLDMQPPVALLIYVPEEPKKAVFYPFARFSPEWQAIRWGLAKGVPTRFMDLPQAHRMAQEGLHEPFMEDPLTALAQAAGETDGERWWERMVEHRQNSTDIFAAVLEAMTELRAQQSKGHRSSSDEEDEEGSAEADRNAEACPTNIYNPPPLTLREQQREAWMRQTIRAAEKEGHQNIAVVCGAWHAPALVNRPPVKDDTALLKGLPKIKVAATWTPWTHSRLQYISGYGAGIESPGWYEHLWDNRSQTAIRWVARIAHLLRKQDLDASPAHIIETVRLAETLCALRGIPTPALRDFQEAVETVMLFGNSAPLKLIHDQLIVGETLGRVPEDTPAIPLQRDLQATQKRLRLPAEAAQRTLDLDLRKPNDLEKSYLLHRLNLLGIHWGEQERATGKSGTFHEIWRIQWQPEFAVDLISASVYGNTLEEAATNKAQDAAAKTTTLPELTTLLEQALLSALPGAIPNLLKRLDSEAAVAADLAHLMKALPALIRVQRYGDVRQTDTSQVGIVVHSLITRIAVGLPHACASLDDDAAAAMLTDIDADHEAINLIQDDDHKSLWRGALQQIGNQNGVHGLIAGRATRLLLDSGELTSEEAARRLSFALSRATDPAQAATWIEGFLKGSGLLLIHDDKLWPIIDNWISQLKTEVFNELLPLLARTFAAFAAPERRQMGERVKADAPAQQAEASTDFDQQRADAVLPLLAKILGIPQPK